jgi:AcrR family transcriptional regulator
MNKGNNKEKIFQVAIKLFAQKGYQNVSMREIATEVDIKASSIYNHYSRKEALLDVIVDYFSNEIQKEIYQAYDITEDIDARAYIEKVIQTNDRFFHSPVNNDIGKIIFQEQFHNEKIQRVLLEELIQRPRTIYARHFEMLMKRGHLRTMNPTMLAIEYHAYFIYRFYENSLTTDYSQIDFDKIKLEQDEHVRLFLENNSI